MDSEIDLQPYTTKLLTIEWMNEFPLSAQHCPQVDVKPTRLGDVTTSRFYFITFIGIFFLFFTFDVNQYWRQWFRLTVMKGPSGFNVQESDPKRSANKQICIIIKVLIKRCAKVT